MGGCRSPGTIGRWPVTHSQHDYLSPLDAIALFRVDRTRALRPRHGSRGAIRREIRGHPGYPGIHAAQRRGRGGASQSFPRNGVVGALGEQPDSGPLAAKCGPRKWLVWSWDRERHHAVELAGVPDNMGCRCGIRLCRCPTRPQLGVWYHWGGETVAPGGDWCSSPRHGCWRETRWSAIWSLTARVGCWTRGSRASLRRSCHTGSERQLRLVYRHPVRDSGSGHYAGCIGPPLDAVGLSTVYRTHRARA